MADGRDLGTERSHTNWRAWGLAVLVVVAIIFIAINSQKVTVKFVFFDVSMPLIFALLIATLLGVAIGYVGPIVRRHRRERSESAR